MTFKQKLECQEEIQESVWEGHSHGAPCKGLCWFVSEVFNKEKRAAWLGHCACEEWWQSGSEVAGAFPVSVLWPQVGRDILRF